MNYICSMVLKISREILAVSILSEIIINIVPNKIYQKYFRIICGVFMIIVCLKPVIPILFSLQTHSDNQSFYEMSDGAVNCSFEKGEEKTLYNNYINKIDSIVNECGYKSYKTEINVNKSGNYFSGIDKVFLILSIKGESDNVSDVNLMKLRLAAYCGTEPEKVMIKWKTE